MCIRQYKFCLTTIFIVSFFFSITAQNEESIEMVNEIRAYFDTENEVFDSVRNLAWKLRYNSSNLALSLTDLSIESANILKDDGDLYDAYNIKGTIHALVLKEYKGSRPYFEKTLSLALSLNDSIKMANAYKNIGLTYKNSSIDSALLYSNLSLTIYNTIGDTGRTTAVLNDIALLYYNNGRYETAISYFNQIINLALKIDHKRALAGTYNNLGNAYSKLGDKNEALKAYQNALEVKEQINDAYGVAGSLSNIGLIYTGQGKYREANEALRKGLKIFQELEIPAKIAEVTINIGYNYVNNGDLDQAINQGLMAKNLLNEIDQVPFYYIEQNQNLLVNSYKMKGNYKEAFNQGNELWELAKEHKENEYSEALANNEVKYETSLKEENIKRLDAENALIAQKLKRKNLLQLLLLISVFSILLMLGLVFSRFRLKQKAEVLLSHKNDLLNKAVEEKQDLLNEMHHRVKNNLQMIAAFLQLQAFNTSNKTLNFALLESIGRVNAMSLIHKVTGQDNDKVNIASVNYIDALIDQIFTSLNSNQKISLTKKIDDFDLNSKQASSIGLIINEAVTNAFKYAFERKTEDGNIEIKLEKKGNEIKLIIADNGYGFDMQQITKGTGMELIDAFVKKLKGDLNIESNSNGTTYQISIPT